MTIRVLILDDDINAHKAACHALAAYSEVEITGQFTSSEKLEEFLKLHTADVLLLDIELGQEFGFSIARKLRQENPELMIVFLTGHSSYAIDGYDFQPVNFLTKPINSTKLEQTITEIKRRVQRSGEQRKAQLMFRLQQGYRILNVRDIYYIERIDRKNYLHLKSETLQISSYTMRELEEMLAEYGFFLCHQSFLINLYRVRRLRDVGRQVYEAELRGVADPVPVSRNHYEKMKTQILSRGISAV